MVAKLKLIGVFLTMNVKKLTAYKGDFLIGLVVSLINVALDLMFFKVVYAHVDTIDGWTQGSLIFLYGVVTVNLALYQLLYGNLRSLKGYLFSGEMERMMWQPQAPLFTIRFRDFSVAPINKLLVGCGLFIVYGNSAVGWQEVATAFLLSAVGISTLSSLMTLASAVLFYTHYLYTPYDSLSEVLKYIHYPFSIFPEVLSKVLTWVFPFAYLGYLPAKAALFSEHNRMVLVYGIGMAFVLKGLATYAFNRALTRYEGSNQ